MTTTPNVRITIPARPTVAIPVPPIPNVGKIGIATPGPKGDQGLPGDSPGIEIVQAAAASIWTLPNPFPNRKANVQIYVGGKVVHTDVQQSAMWITVTFPYPVAGSAVLS